MCEFLFCILCRKLHSWLHAIDYLHTIVKLWMFGSSLYAVSVKHLRLVHARAAKKANQYFYVADCLLILITSHNFFASLHFVASQYHVGNDF